MKGINYENILYDTLSQEANLFVNKKLLAQLESDLALFISFLIDKGRYHKLNNGLTEDGFFYATNEDIYLFTRIPRKRIVKLKKQGAELELFFIKKSSSSFNGATYYKLNFEKILEIISTDKTAMELAYEASIPTDEEIGYSEETIMKLSYRDLKLVCKKLKIPYKGTDRKINLIEKILENQGLNKLTPEVSTGGQEKCQPVDTKSANRLTPKVPQKKSKEKNQIEKNQIEKNQIMEEDDFENDFFENLFKEFGINFTKTNKNSVLKIRKHLSLKDTELYLRETYTALKENKEVKSIAALFSAKIAKEERQINSKKEIKEAEKVNQLVEKLKLIEEPTKDQEDYIAIYEKLDTYDKLKIEEKAIELLVKEQQVDESFLLKTKQIQPTLYHGMIKEYLERVMSQNKAE